MPDRAGEESPTPFKDRPTSEYLMTTVGGALLAFNAGFLNGTTMNDNDVSTTHVSGTATRFGRYIALEEKYKIALNGGIIFSFLFGSFITGCIITHQTFYLGHTYGKVIILAGVLLCTAYLLELYYEDLYWYDYCAAVVAGMQNTMFSRYSGNIMRTTHVTGTTTDMGLFLGRRVVGNTEYMWKFYVLVCLYSSFFLGSFLAGEAYPHVGKSKTWLNIVIFLFIGSLYVIYMMFFHFSRLSLWEIFFVGEDRLISVMKDRELKCQNENKDVRISAASMIDGIIDDDASLCDDYRINLSAGRLTDDSISAKSISCANFPATDTQHTNRSISKSPLKPLHEWDSWAFNLVLVAVVLLAFNAGFINGTCQSAPNGTSVTHMTSTTTKAALNLAYSRYDDFSINVGNILSFFGGAFIAGTIVSDDVFRLSIQYVKIWLLGIIALSGAAFILEADDTSYYSGYLCSVAAGLQNAMASKFSGCVIRTTHVSGSTCDLGSTLAKVFIRGDHKDAWKIKLLSCAVMSFIFGGFIGQELYSILDRHQLFACVLVYFMVGIAIFVMNYHIANSQVQAMQIPRKTLILRTSLSPLRE